MKERKKEIFELLFITGISLVLAYLFYIVISIDGDAYATLMVMYRRYDLGMTPIPGITALIDRLQGLLYSIYGINEKVVYGEFALEYFLATMSVFFLVKEGKKECKLFSFLFLAYCLLPGKTTQYYHLITAFFSLFFILIIAKIIAKKEIKYVVILVVSIFLYFKIAFDIALLGIYVILPIFIYGMISLLHSKKYRKHMPIVMVVFLVVLSAYRLCYVVLSKFDILLPYSFSGYGGGGYTSWADAADIISKNLGYYTKVLFELWNIQGGDNLVSIDSIGICIRSAFLLYAIYIAVRNFILIIKNGTNSISTVDGICATSFFVISFTNIINGATTEHGGISRYAGIAGYLLAILLVRELSNLVNKDNFLKFWEIKENRRSVYYSGISIALIFLSVVPFFYGKAYFERSHNKLCSRIGDAISENGLAYGLASWEDALITWVRSEGEAKVFPARLGSKTRELIKDGFNADSEDGSNYFNYIAITPQNATGENRETIKEMYGEPVDEILIKNQDGWIECAVMVYDYDVRWRPEYFYGYDNCFENREIPMGISRLIVNGTGISDAELEFDNVDKTQIVKHLLSGNEVIFDIVSKQNLYYSNIKVKTEGEVQFGISERLYSAISLFENLEIQAKNQIVLPVENDCTEYRIVLRGENVNDLELVCNEEIELIRQDAGSERLVYYVNNSNKLKFDIMIQNPTKENIQIDKCDINEVKLQFRN